MPIQEDAWTGVLECNQAVWGRLLAWELLLFQLADEKYRSDERFIAMVQFACQLFERDLDTSFAIEENGLYAHVHAEVPKLRGLIQQLRMEHQVIREHLKLIHLEYGDDAGFDRLELLRASVGDLANALRAHMLREERELVPALVGARPVVESAPGGFGPYATDGEARTYRKPAAGVPFASEDVA